MKKAIWLVGFGGPRSLNEVRPFILHIMEGTSIPAARLQEVVRHYEAVGGFSPYDWLTQKQKAALVSHLEKRGVRGVPVEVGFRHSEPGFTDGLRSFKEKGVEKVAVVVLSVFRSPASFGRYVEEIDEAGKKAGVQDIGLEFADPFSDEPLFVEAQAERVARALEGIPDEGARETHVLFTAHSIPSAMAARCRYAEEFEGASRRVAEALRLDSWGTAYQSRSGRPDTPWLGPDVRSVFEQRQKRHIRNALLVPIGFLCDNVEVLYDLDVEARRLTEAGGLRYFRASTVLDEPRFIRLLADKALKILGETKEAVSR